MRTTTITLYQFDELSDKAKERARDWFRQCRDSNDFDSVIEDAVRMAAILGIQVDTHPVTLMNGKTRYDPSIWWSVGYCQSDGAGFDGRYSYAKGAHKAIRKEAPEDTTLHEMADTLLALQRRYRWQLTATIKDRDHWPQVESDGGDLTEEEIKTFHDVFRDFNHWIYTQLRTEDEYRNEDAQVDADIRANEYEFDAEGNRA